eukprot:7281031-Alexandrium_andersonii.AAC.1
MSARSRRPVGTLGAHAANRTCRAGRALCMLSCVLCVLVATNHEEWPDSPRFALGGDTRTGF